MGTTTASYLAVAHCMLNVWWIELNEEFNKLRTKCIQQQDLHLGEQSTWRYTQIYSKQSYQGTQHTRLVGLTCAWVVGSETCTQQAGGRSGKQGYTETPGLTQQLKVLSLLLPNSPMLMFASSCIRCQVFLTGVLNQVRIGAWEKIAGICSDPDGRVDLSLGKLFSKPPDSKSEHTHICHSVGIL